MQAKRRKRAWKGHTALQDRNVAWCIKSAVKSLPDLDVAASRVTLEQWCNGLRRAPSWFVDYLAGRLLAQELKLRSIREALGRYPVGVGRGVGLKRYWHDRKDREAREMLREFREQMRQQIVSGNPSPGSGPHI